MLEDCQVNRHTCIYACPKTDVLLFLTALIHGLISRLFFRSICQSGAAAQREAAEEEEDVSQTKHSQSLLQ